MNFSTIDNIYCYISLLIINIYLQFVPIVIIALFLIDLIIFSYIINNKITSNELRLSFSVGHQPHLLKVELLIKLFDFNLTTSFIKFLKLF